MAERIIANLTLDTYQRNKIPPLVIPQHDYGARYIRVRITEQGENVSVASGSVVSIIAKRMADGQSAAFSGSVNADGSVLVPVTQWMLDAPSDDVDCHVAVTGTGYQYSTTSFVISPQERENPSYLEEDDPRVNIVEEALIKVVEEADRAEEQADLAQSAASTAASDAKEAARQEVEQLVGQLGIVQSLGNSRMAVVSQAVTTGLYNRNAKRIANLEQGFNEQFETDSSVSYVKDVPEGALPYAEIKKIGGMTYKDGNTLKSAKVTEVESAGVNLLPLNDMETTIFGCAVRVANGVITINGTATGSGGRNVAISTVTLPAGTYKFYANENNFFLSRVGGNNEIIGTIFNTFTLTEDTTLVLGYNFTSGKTYSISTTAHINRGTTSLPYTPYREPVSLPIPAEVRGSENLIPYPYIFGGSATINGVTFTANSDGSITANGTSTEVTHLELANVTFAPNTNYIMTGSVRGRYDLYLRNPYTPSWKPFSFDTEITTTVIVYIDANITFANEKIYPMLSEGSTTLPYEPYSAGKGLDGYGLGVSDTVYNYIDWEKKQFVKRCASVDLGTLDWGYSDGDKRFFVIPSDIAEVNSELIMRALCAEYLPISYNEFYTDLTRDKTICRYINYLFVRNLLYTDAATFKAAMSGVMLVYELATPEVTDISDLISEDNFIGVEGNGTLTFKNAYEYAVPSEVEYQVEV